MRYALRLVMLLMGAVSALYADGIVDISRVLEAARVIERKDESVGGGQRFNRDCSGTINAIFAEAGFPLSRRSNLAYKSGMNGTAIQHAIAQDVPLVELQPGDLVFFDNTYDRNGNGKSDDILTHVGIVTSYDNAKGIVYFIHYNTWMDKIIEQQLSVLEPSNKDLNIILRWPSKDDPQAKRYAGELLHSFGRITTF